MIKWLTDRPWLMALILIVVVNAPAYALVQVSNARTDRIVECISAWGDRVSNRTSALSSASEKRQEALDALLRAAGEQDRAKTLDRYNAYISASDKYKAEQKAHPVPTSPRLAC